MKPIIIAALACLAVQLTHAQSLSVPLGMAYQGRLTDANGVPAPDGIGYEVEVRLWSAATLGSQLWGARYTGVPVKGGAFSLILGAPGGVSIGTPTDLKSLFINNTSVFLGLTVTKGSTGKAVSSPSEILPRQQLVSTPFAFRSQVTASVDPNIILSGSLKDGEVKTPDVADAAITTSKLAAGAVTLATIAANTINSSAIAGNSIEPDRLAADYAVFWEEQPGNVHGGTTTAGWMRRTLNTSRNATPPGGSDITRSGNTITLQNGVYLIRASGPMYASGESQLVLRDVTGNPTTPVVALRGTSDYGSDAVMSASTIEDYLSVTVGPRQYELWQYFRVGDTNYGGRLGVAVNLNNTAGAPDRNIYSRIHIQKVK